jgi:hypothetical protein
MRRLTLPLAFLAALAILVCVTLPSAAAPPVAATQAPVQLLAGSPPAPAPALAAIPLATALAGAQTCAAATAPDFASPAFIACPNCPPGKTQCGAWPRCGCCDQL